MNDLLRILIVDDNITYRQILTHVLAEIPHVECVGTAATGKLALMKMETAKPDLVLLDVEMPEMDGIETLRQLRQSYPQVYAIMVSAPTKETAINTMRSLEMGALDFIPKPLVKTPQEGVALLKNQLGPLIQLVRTKKQAALTRSLTSAASKLITPGAASTSTAPSKPPPSQPPASKNRAGKFDWIVIGVSTGGPQALAQVLPALNPEIPCPILIVQHMPPLFTQSLAERLHKVSRLTVQEAKQGDIPQPGNVYIAPGGTHMVVHKAPQGHLYLAMNDGPPVQNCKPAVDVLFRSLAGTTEGHVLALVMTGMGRDGTDGVRALKRKSAICLIQDEASSVVWGMPGSVYEAGLSDEVLPLLQLGSRINELVKG